jgi:hypothetical protein
VRGTPEDEYAFHDKFAQHRLEGEWFKGDILEDVLNIISIRKEYARQIRRKTIITDATGDVFMDEPACDENGAIDGDSGIQGVSRIPGLRMKSFSLKLTKCSPTEEAAGQPTWPRQWKRPPYSASWQPGWGGTGGGGRPARPARRRGHAV